jgi:hypothetical protein
MFPSLVKVPLQVISNSLRRWVKKKNRAKQTEVQQHLGSTNFKSIDFQGTLPLNHSPPNF